MTEWILTSSVLILIILGLRFLLRGKISPLIQYCLWGLVLVRLLVPFSVSESVISVSNLLQQPVIQTAESDIRRYENIYDQIAAQYTQSGSAPAPSQIRQETLDRVYSDTYHNLSDKYSQSGSSVSDVQIQTEARQHVDLIRLASMVTDALPTIWYGGIAVVCCALLFSNLHFALRLRKNRKRLETPDIPLPVYETDIAATPCLFGLFRPMIYLTSEAAHDAGMRRHILIHELTHYRHRDHIWSLLRGVCMMLHWYNPLVWVAAILSKQDGELACDEAAIRALGEQERTAYGRTLIGMTCIRRDAQNLLITATTMVGSKKTLKERITRIAQKPKTALYTLIACILVASLAVGCTFTGSLSTGLTKDDVWKKVLTAVEAYNNRDHYHISVVSAYEYGDDTPNGNLSNEFYQANGNEVRRFSAGDQVEIVLRYSGNMYVAVEGSEWHDFENSANLTDLSFQIPAEENLVLSWTQEGDLLVVVCDYSYQEPDEHALVDPTVTFWINSDGNLDKYSYTYGVDTQNSTDYIHTVTFTVHADDAAGVNRKILNTYNEAAAALGLEPVDSIYSQDEIYEQLKAVVQEINSREAYHFKCYIAHTAPSKSDPTQYDYIEGWVSGEDMYTEQIDSDSVTPDSLHYDGNIYIRRIDNLWFLATKSSTTADTYRAVLPSQDQPMTWTETEDYLDVSFTNQGSPNTGVEIRLDASGRLVWYARYYPVMVIQGVSAPYEGRLYTVIIYQDTAPADIRAHLDDIAPPLIAAMEMYTFPTDQTEPETTEPPTEPVEILDLPDNYTVDDLVTAYEEQLTWTDLEGNFCDTSFSIPLIFPFSEDAVAIQNRISQRLSLYLEETRQNKAQGLSSTFLSIRFEAWLNGNILSLLITEQYDMGDYLYYEVYNFDMETGRYLSAADMVSRYLPGLSYPEFLLAIAQRAQDDFVRSWPDTALTVMPEQDVASIADTGLYLNGDGTLCLLCTEYFPAGAEAYPTRTEWTADIPSHDWAEAYRWFLSLPVEAYTASDYAGMLYDALYASPVEFVECLADAKTADRILALMENEPSCTASRLAQVISVLESTPELSSSAVALISRLAQILEATETP